MVQCRTCHAWQFTFKFYSTPCTIITVQAWWALVLGRIRPSIINEPTSPCYKSRVMIMLTLVKNINTGRRLKQWNYLFIRNIACPREISNLLSKESNWAYKYNFATRILVCIKTSNQSVFLVNESREPLENNSKSLLCKTKQ